MQNFIPSNKCLNLLKSIETLSLRPYLDKGFIPTIGYGCTYYEDDTRVKLTDKAITTNRATELFHNIIVPYYQCVNKVITANMTQQQFDAFFIMCYNCGVGAFSRPAQVAKWFNLGNIPMVAEWWVKSFITVTNPSSLTIEVDGLINRRKAELNIFQNGIYERW